MLKSIIAAFSMYSKIPMPTIKWDSKSTKYTMCFFPFVGMVIALFSIGVCYGFTYLKVSKNLSGVVLTIIPFMVTGGIHMDGFLDTIDAKSSYRSKEERLEILKDPHTGAFAIIYGILYILLYFGFMSEITKKEIVFVGIGYIYSRILSGLSVVIFQKAKKEGMLATAQDNAQKNVKWILLVEGVFCIGSMLFLNWFYGIVCILVGLGTFLYYKRMSNKIFGGITGDLAGYFLQICELLILMGLVIAKGIGQLEGIAL